LSSTIGPFDLALSCLQARDFQGAEKHLLKALKGQPRHIGALNLLALLLAQSGRYAQAEKYFIEAIKVFPSSDATYYNYGVALRELKRPIEALEMFGKALALNPSSPDTWNNRGVLLSAGGDFQAAIDDFDKAVALDPRNANAYSNKGKALAELKWHQDALAAYDRAIALQPGLAEAWVGRGIVCSALDRSDEALAAYDRAITLKPNLAEARLGRGNVLLKARKRHEEAIAEYDQAIAAKPDLSEAWVARGHALNELRRCDDAIVAFTQAIALDPKAAEAWLGRGNSLQALKQFKDALADYDQAIALKPDLAPAWLGRSSILAHDKRFDEASAACDRAIALNPDLPEARIAPGNILLAFNRPSEALESHERALAAMPGIAKIHTARGSALRVLNRLDEALASYERALELEPDQWAALTERANALGQFGRMNEAMAAFQRGLATYPRDAGLLTGRASVLAATSRFDAAISDFEQALAVAPYETDALCGLANALLQVCDWDKIEKLRPQVLALIDRDEGVPSMLLIRMLDDPSMHLKSARSYVRSAVPLPPTLSPRAPGPAEKIRIAYLSADFRQHPVGHLLPALIERHDRKRFDVSAISFGPDDGSEIRARLIKAFDRFEDMTFKSDHDVALRLQELQVDIAVDLMGHTQFSRPSILAYRPAPINVSFLGYPGTTGADFIDYILADAVVLPFDRQHDYTEKIVHLPGSFFVRDVTTVVSPQVPSRTEAGLPEKSFVFCCFNNSYKLAAPMFKIWMRLLASVADSVLWLSRVDDATSANLRKAAGDLGIDPDRLIFAPRVPSMADHLARHQLADLFLDTLPYNAHSTANDALWAGLPVLTNAGQAFAGRVAASMLTAVGLPELVTNSLEEYEATAKALATEPTLLHDVRRKLEGRQTSLLFDLDRYCNHLEGAYTMMRERWQRGEAPEAFSVPLLDNGTIAH
jgi:protein O-GlcNAc transferase